MRAETTSDPRILDRYHAPFIALVIAGLIACAILVFFDPFAANSILPPCLFHELTQLYCPGCGVTRALHALLHGQLALALSMNPLAVLSIPSIPVMLWNSAHPGSAWVAKVSDARVWLALVLCFFILRNLPWAPFFWLAPG